MGLINKSKKIEQSEYRMTLEWLSSKVGVVLTPPVEMDGKTVRRFEATPNGIYLFCKEEGLKHECEFNVDWKALFAAINIDEYLATM